MPFELFPASRCAERGKRKLEDDADRDSPATAAAGSQQDTAADGGKEAAETTTDEEVEEFFAILKRLHAATKHIEKIDGASGFLMGKRSKRMKASEEVEIRAEKSREHKLDLDLNLEPRSVESDGKESRSGRSHDLPSLAADSRRM